MARELAAALVRPLIFSVAPPRDDSVVIVAQAPEIVDGPILRDVVLSRSYGWDGEVDAGKSPAYTAGFHPRATVDEACIALAKGGFHVVRLDDAAAPPPKPERRRPRSAAENPGGI